MDAIAAYVARHATPLSVALASRIERRFDAAVVIPAKGESPALIDGVAPALAGRDALAIVVVNGGPADAATNATLLAALRDQGAVHRLADGVDLVAGRGGHWLAIDRASDGRRDSAGVGHARRLGCDLAVALRARDGLAREFVDTTDADATLPPDYFDQAPPDAVALTRAFCHVPSGDAHVDDATALYEIRLRYYVAALASAGSPWAMHTIGSCLSVRASAYAAVRGLPTRQAGEDFYLLAKLAKLGPVARGLGAPIRIASRISGRVPFGTGPATAKIEAAQRRGEVPSLYDPASFVAVGMALEALTRWCEGPMDAPPLCSVPDDSALKRALQDLGVDARLPAALHGASSQVARRRRLHEWLDAFQTLKLVHRLRAQGQPEIPWPDALAQLCARPRHTDVARALLELSTDEAQLPAAGYRAPD